MGFILFIHGMGHDPNRQYWKVWAERLLPCLVEQGSNPANIQFGGIYYYDLVPEPGDGWKKITPFFQRELRQEMKRDLWEHAVRSGDIRKTLGRGSVDGFINLVADNFGDIFSYLLNDQIYQQVNNRFYRAIEETPAPITLVAYSLGSMISFCAQQQRPELAAKISHFITLGSPIFWFRKWLNKRTQLSKPPGPALWTNLAVRIDVACPHLVGYSTCGPDVTIECELEKYNPVKGHLAYFSHPEALKELARAVDARSFTVW